MPGPLVTVQTSRGPVEVPADVAQRLNLSPTQGPLSAEGIQGLLAPIPEQQGPAQFAQLAPGTAADFQMPGEGLPPRAEESGLPGATRTDAVPAPGEGTIVAPPGMEAEQQLREASAEQDIAQQATGEPVEVPPEVAEIGRAESPSALPSLSLRTDGLAVLDMSTASEESKAALVRALRSTADPGTYRVQGDQVLFGREGSAPILSAFPELRPRFAELTGNAMLLPEQEQRRGSGVLRGTLEEQFSETLRPEVPGAISQAMGAYSEKLDALRQEALQGRLDLNTAQSTVFQEFADLRGQQEEAIRNFEGAAAQQMRSRIDALEQGIQAVGDRRVDPEAWFGQGGGRRLAAGIAVALGHLASALGGGPNVAFETMQSRIEQNITAQELTLRNQRAAVGMQANALAYFRQALGDERAAGAAARAAAWEEAINRASSYLRSSQSPVLQANGNALIVAARLQQLKHLADAYQNGWEMTRQITTRRPISPSAASQEAAQRLMSPEERQAQQEAQEARRAAPRGRRGPGRPRPRVQAPQDPQMTSFSTVESPRAERFSQLTEQAGRREGQFRPPNNLTSTREGESVTEIFNSLPEGGSAENARPGTQAAVWSAASNGHQFQRTMRRLITIAERSPELIEGEYSGEARALALFAQGQIRQMLRFGALTGNEHEIVSQVAGNPEEFNRRVLFGNEADSLRGTLTAVMSNLDSMLELTDLRVRSLGSETRRGQ